MYTISVLLLRHCPFAEREWLKMRPPLEAGCVYNIYCLILLYIYIYHDILFNIIYIYIMFNLAIVYRQRPAINVGVPSVPNLL